MVVLSVFPVTFLNTPCCVPSLLPFFPYTTLYLAYKANPESEACLYNRGNVHTHVLIMHCDQKTGCNIQETGQDWIYIVFKYAIVRLWYDIYGRILNEFLNFFWAKKLPPM